MLFGVGHVGRQMIAGNPVVGGATLDLGFMVPGSLDPRLTFTRASTATYFDATGTMQSAAVNAPRWDYDPSTHALNGLLIEEARTNLHSPSINWSANATASASVDGTIQNSGVAPDGSTTAMKLIPSGAVNVHAWFTLFSGAVSTAFSHSMYAKAAGYNYVRITLENTAFGANSQSCNFDLSNGTIVSQSGGANASIKAVGGGWYRLSVTATSLGTAGNYVANLQLYDTLAHMNGDITYAGDMVSGILAWGKQVEQGAFPTSYIPTTAAAVTRAIDLTSIAPANMGFFVSPGGSWMAEFIPQNYQPAGIYQRVVLVPPAPNGAGPLITNAGVGVTYDGGTILPTVNSAPVNTVQKMASTYAGAIGQVCLNGGPVASAVMGPGYAGAVTSGVALMVAAGGGAQNTTGWLRRLRYWPRALSASELQQVTT